MDKMKIPASGKIGGASGSGCDRWRYRSKMSQRQHHPTIQSPKDVWTCGRRSAAFSRRGATRLQSPVTDAVQNERLPMQRIHIKWNIAPDHATWPDRLILSPANLSRCGTLCPGAYPMSDSHPDKMGDITTNILHVAGREYEVSDYNSTPVANASLVHTAATAYSIADIRLFRVSDIKIGYFAIPGANFGENM
ncbi:hypothetical protein M747DRAFT_245648 [Aspergillus niger ATCC 13496]|uniref:Uncharacterized protein n=3 Tax=Aspergillus niger TaxID=5061 RepID=A2QSJ0_ASPNC|nr:hypothetical protein An08g10900 [Aspergillus niger]RDH16230.1 hypothetical protein M747DRAFT_245648 [Aspergillus niger ATCC 13496]CAK45762.1 hypothetical protein An08g10900 [Aspergillus niger]